MKKMKKTLCLLLALVMCLSLVNLSAFAADGQAGSTEQTESIGDVQPGPTEETEDDAAGGSNAQNPDKGNGDAQNPDEGNGNAQNPDEGNGDAQNPDEGSGDAQNPDESNGDAQNPDEGGSDAQNPDEGGSDAQNPDEGSGDDQNPDEGSGDAQNPDEGSDDAQNPDEGGGDAQNPDEDNDPVEEVPAEVQAFLDAVKALEALSETDDGYLQAMQDVVDAYNALGGVQKDALELERKEAGEKQTYAEWIDELKAKIEELSSEAEDEVPEAVQAFLDAVDALSALMDEDEPDENAVMAAQQNVIDLYDALTEDQQAGLGEDYAQMVAGLKEVMTLEETGDGVVEVRSYEELTAAITAATEPTTIKLTQSVDATSAIVIPAGANITLTAVDGAVLGRADGYTSGHVLTVNGTLTLDNVTVDGRNVDAKKALVYVANTGTLTMNGGVIENGRNTAASTKQNKGTALWNEGALRINGGQIRNNYTSKAQDGTVYSATSDVEIQNAAISGNTGGGLYISNSQDTRPVTLTNVSITGNTGNANALYSYTAGEVRLTDCKITENNSGGQNVVHIWGGSSPERVLSGCEISGNETTGYSAVVLMMAASNATISNCKVQNNTAQGAGGGAIVQTAPNVSAVLSGGTLIQGNHSTSGAVKLNGTMKIDGAVIKENHGTTTGGIFLNSNDKTALTFTSGAIYGNEGGKGNDLYSDNKLASYSLIPASQMSDLGSDVDFAAQAYTWFDVNNTPHDSFEAAKGVISLTARSNVTRYAAQIGETKYETLADAVDAAAETEVIEVIWGDDGLGNNLILNEPVEISKPVTVQMKGQNVLNVNDDTKPRGHLFDVKESGVLTLTGTAMTRGIIAVEKDGSLTMDGGITGYYDAVSKQMGYLRIDAQPGSSFTINGTVGNVDNEYAPVPCVWHYAGQVITAGEDFDVRSNLSIDLDPDVYDEFNNAKDVDELEDVVLIQGCGSDAVASKVTFTKAFTSSFVRVKAVDGNIVLTKAALSAGGVYLDGATGDDSGNGTNVDNAVKTFEKAKELAKDKGGVIYVTGALTTSGTLDGTLENGKVTLKRHPSYKGNLVSANGDLTLTNITLDGSAELVQDSESLIFVNSGTTTLGAGAALQNNDVTNCEKGYPSYCGGGVYVHSSGTLVMNEGSEIKDCTAVMGGGVLANGTFEMNGGTISGNRAVNLSTSTGYTGGYGGGVAIITNSGRMTMNGGTIAGNVAEVSGGGIALPMGYLTRSEGSKLFVSGGMIAGNSAVQCGGGIFVQCGNEATIGTEDGGNKVQITGNTASGSSVPGKSVHFAGGGIYVNGGRDGYENGLVTLYRVVVRNNNAGIEGGGLAGCSTSDTKIYLTNGGALYNNTSKCGQDDLATTSLNTLGLRGANPHVQLSPVMLGFGAYNWRYADNELYEDEDAGDGVPLDGLSGVLYLYSGSSDRARANAEKQANVFIEGNFGGNRGGGIGSNGDVVIGSRPKEDVTLTVNKMWEVPEGTQLPDYVDVEVLCNVDNGEPEVYGIVRVYEANDWKATVELPALDSEGDSYTYSVREVRTDDFVGTVVDNEENSFTITNRPAGSLTIKKEVSGGGDAAVNQVYSFTVTGSNGFSQIVSVKGNESETLRGLFPGDYTVTEDQRAAALSGYTLKVDVPNGGQVSVAEGGTASITVRNTYTPITLDGDVTSLTVTKLWAGDTESNRPASVTVQLYDNGVASGGPVVLNSGNSWSSKWENLLVEGHNYTVGEINVPDGYESSQVVTNNDDGSKTVTITNTYEGTDIPDNPPPTTDPDPRPTPKPDPDPEPTDIPDPEVPKTEPDPEPTDIPDPEVPTTDLPDEQPPLVELPDEQPPLIDWPIDPVWPWPIEDPDEQPPLVDLPDDPTPLANVPQTGDYSLMWLAALVLSVSGLAVLTLKKREDEEN